MVALAPDQGPAVAPALHSLARDPEVVAHNGPYRIVYATLTARGSSSRVVVHGAAETPGAVNRPLVTSGRWLPPAARFSNEASPPRWASASANTSPSPAARTPSSGSR